MKRKQLIESRAYRILRPLAQYRQITTAADILQPVTFQEFPEREHLIGIYENIPNDYHESITVTTSGCHWFLNDEWRFAKYDQILKVEVSDDQKMNKRLVDRLVVHLKAGDVIELPIRGGKSGTPDAWEFLRFLDRVVEDVKSTEA